MSPETWDEWWEYLEGEVTRRQPELLQFCSVTGEPTSPAISSVPDPASATPSSSASSSKSTTSVGASASDLETRILRRLGHDAEEASKNAVKKHDLQSAQAKKVMLAFIPATVKPLVRSCETAHQVLKKWASTYRLRDEEARLSALDKLAKITQGHGEETTLYVARALEMYR